MGRNKERDEKNGEEIVTVPTYVLLGVQSLFCCQVDAQKTENLTLEGT